MNKKIFKDNFSYPFPYETETQRPIVRTDLLYGLREMIEKIVYLYGYDLTIIEIGSYCGESTVEFAKIFKKIIAVDPWKNGYDETDGSSFKSNMDCVKANFDFLTRNFKNIESYQMTSKEYYEKNSNKIVDFVYIDGNHSYESVIEDLQMWFKKCDKCICGHDFFFEGVQKALKEFLHKKLNIPIFLFPDSSWIIERKYL